MNKLDKLTIELRRVMIDMDAYLSDNMDTAADDSESDLRRKRNVIIADIFEAQTPYIWAGLAAND